MAYISSIVAENFRVLQRVELRDLAKITGIWGRNGSGKSALLHSVVALRNCFQPFGWSQPFPHQFNSGGISLGTWSDVRWRGGTSPTTLSVTLGFVGGAMARVEAPPNQAHATRSGTLDPGMIRYFPPQRTLGARFAHVQDSPTSDLGVQTSSVHPFVHWFYHEKIRERQRTGTPNEVDRIDDWMTRVGFGPLSDRLNPEAGPGQVTARFDDPLTHHSTSFVDGGYGGLSIAPIILEGYSFRDGILLIEEPEISLHPGAQAEIFDFFLEMVRSRGHQIIFTSHSPYLLGRFARQCRDEGVDDGLVGVFSARKDSNGSHFNRESLSELVTRFNNNQNLLDELHTRWPG